MLSSVDHKVLVNFLQKCSYKQLKQIHAVIVTTTSFARLYPEIRLKFLKRSTEYGNMDYADLVFNQMGGLRDTEIPLWNAVVRGYAYNGPQENCLKLFDEMTTRGLKANNFTYPYVLDACSQMGAFGAGEKVHGRVIKSGFESSFHVGNALFDFYVKKFESCEMGFAKNASLIDVSKIFYGMCERTLEMCNKMMAKYASARNIESGRELFDKMTKRDVVSWNTMISAYAKAGEVRKAKDLFDKMPDKNVVSWTSMLGAYGAVGDIESARQFFAQMPLKNVVSWNCMLSSYINAGEFQQALDLFIQMQSSEVKPDSYTFVSALSACSKLNNLEWGTWVHSLMRDWSKMGIIVGTALVEMYANCGDIIRCFPLFIKIPNKDVFCYNVIIKSLASHGRSRDAIKIYLTMQNRGLTPNEHAYSCALFACSHGGLVEEGLEIFRTMQRDSKIGPSLEHYSSLIDLLCKNDRVEEAIAVVEEMKMEPDVAIWGALLGGCLNKGDIKLAERIIRKAIESKSEEAGVHVLLSNIHASMGQWPQALQARNLMEEIGMWKITGRSSIMR